MAHLCLYKVKKPPTLLYWRRHGLQSYRLYNTDWIYCKMESHTTHRSLYLAEIYSQLRDRQLSIFFYISTLSCQLDFPVNYRRPYQRHNSGLSGHKGDVNASYIHVCTSISGIPKGFSGYSLLGI